MSDTDELVPTEAVVGYISEAHGEDFDLRPQKRKAGKTDTDVYEVNISQKVQDEYLNIRVSVFGKAIPKVERTVEKVRAKNKAARKNDEPSLPICFQGQWQEPFESRSGKVTYKFRAYDASPFFTSYRD